MRSLTLVSIIYKLVWALELTSYVQNIINESNRDHYTLLMESIDLSHTQTLKNTVFLMKKRPSKFQAAYNSIIERDRRLSILFSVYVNPTLHEFFFSAPKLCLNPSLLKFVIVEKPNIEYQGLLTEPCHHRIRGQSLFNLRDVVDGLHNKIIEVIASDQQWQKMTHLNWFKKYLSVHNTKENHIFLAKTLSRNMLCDIMRILVTSGINYFVDIVESYLTEGDPSPDELLVRWLIIEIATMGLQLPSDMDPGSIEKLFEQSCRIGDLPLKLRTFLRTKACQK